MNLRVAVVVPFHTEPLEQLEQCVESVMKQGIAMPRIIGRLESR